MNNRATLDVPVPFPDLCSCLFNYHSSEMNHYFHKQTTTDYGSTLKRNCSLVILNSVLLASSQKIQRKSENMIPQHD